MTITSDLTPGKSIWKPKFIEEINRDMCLDCDLVDQIDSSNGFSLQSITRDEHNAEHQIMTVANPEQCANCPACTSGSTENFYTHYSFSV